MVLKIQNLNFRQANFLHLRHFFRYRPQSQLATETISNSFSTPTATPEQITISSEPIQFTSGSNIKISLSDSTDSTALSPPPPSPSSSSSSTLSSKAIKPAGQFRAYSPQHFYHNRILDQYACQSVNTVTLRQLVVFGRNITEERLLKSGNYVRTELPIRLAHRIRDFQNLPFIIGTNPHMAMVYDLYWSAFEKFRKFPLITNMDENDEFCDTVKGLLKEHLVVIPQLAMGISECSHHLPRDQLDKFMNIMLRSRISRRVLAEQQIALTENWHDPGYVYGQDGHDSYIGIVSTQCNSKEIVERCANMTRNLYRTIYKIEPPEVIVDGHVNTTFSYIPDHIEYILYELLKNSIRGIIGKHSPSLKDIEISQNLNSLNNDKNSTTSISNNKNTSNNKNPSSPISSPYPPISVTICSSPADLFFRISDQGGGISDDIYPHIWSFVRTSTTSNHKFENFTQVPQMAATVQEYEQFIIPPTLNLGIGLPMSKVYTEYWGGGITVFTMDGYGTDAYVKISRLGNKEENLE